MDIWKPIDKLGYALFTWWTPKLQVRTGTVSVVAGFGLMVWGPFAGEQFLIYQMSAFALILGGMGVLVTAILAVKQDPDTSEADIDPEAE